MGVRCLGQLVMVDCGIIVGEEKERERERGRKRERENMCVSECYKLYSQTFLFLSLSPSLYVFRSFSIYFVNSFSPSLNLFCFLPMMIQRIIVYFPTLREYPGMLCFRAYLLCHVGCLTTRLR